MSQATSSAPRPTDVGILVVSCDRFQDLWGPFFTCFFRYWPDCPYPVYLGANRAIHPDPRVRAICVGEDVDYSSNLQAMLAAVPQPWVIAWIEDRVLSAPVDTARMARLVEKAQSQGAAYLKLLANHPFGRPGGDGSDVGEIPRGSRYRACMTVGLWRKDALLGLLRRGETAWDLERNGSRRSDGLSAAFLALTFAARQEPPISDVHLIVKGHLCRDALRFVSREHLGESLAGRPVQTLRSQWYVRSYVACLDLAAALAWRWRRIRRAVAQGMDRP